ncbi:MAG: ABC transporter permease [Lachnospiraceae bacterium]|nr:ABC transporter permease [Lachnospiraceae bacterium]
MNRGLYQKLALNNIRKNRNTFYPFTLSCIVMIAMFYMIHSISNLVNESQFIGAAAMKSVLEFGTFICGLFSWLVIFYTNSFLMKKRSKELGLYSVLGMEKKHIAKVIFWEIGIVGIGSILIGLLAGVLFSKLIFMLLLKIVHLQTGFTFAISTASLFITILLFIAIFLTVLTANSIMVYRLKPIDLMRKSRSGEREPKAKGFMAVLGLMCLGSGYYLALTIQNPLKTIEVFFVAVLFVIAGTYLMFISGSIVLLKLLKNNKNYYYQKNHFITVSGMIYRMKQNAIGLSNICILSTMVLVALTFASSLYVGTEDTLQAAFYKDVMTDYYREENSDYTKLEQVLKEYAAKYHVTIEDVEQYYHYHTMGILEGDDFCVDYEEDPRNIEGSINLDVMTLDDYNKLMNTDYECYPGKIWIYVSKDRDFEGNTMKISDREYTICGRMTDVPGMGAESQYNEYQNLWLVVPDLKTMEEIKTILDRSEVSRGNKIFYNYNFNLKGKERDKKAFCADINNIIQKAEIADWATIEDIYTKRDALWGLYGSIFFIGIFLGILFMSTTVMIIYYKQVSEGYDDKDRFIILQKVGMSGEEVKGVIKSQILLMFFLPILFALIHICFAFNAIKKMLVLGGLTNTAVFIICIIATVGVFMIVYGIVYSLTARTYYKITCLD